MNPWYLNRRVARFWQAAFIQHLFTELFWRYKKIVKEYPGYLDYDRVCKQFRQAFDEVASRIGTKHDVTYESQFTFDETVWPPEDDCRMKRGSLFLKFPPTAEYHAFQLDFDKPIRDGGVSIIAYCDGFTVPHLLPTDVFHVKFVEGKDESD